MNLKKIYQMSEELKFVSLRNEDGEQSERQEHEKRHAEVTNQK
jgi:hypothetical protein